MLEKKVDRGLPYCSVNVSLMRKTITGKFFLSL